MRFAIDLTQRKNTQTCFPDSVRVEDISLIACPLFLFYLIEVNILTKGITVLTSVIQENSKELKKQAGMPYGKLIKCLNATNLCWERQITKFYLLHYNIFDSSC